MLLWSQHVSSARLTLPRLTKPYDVPYKGAAPALSDLLAGNIPGDVRFHRHGAASGALGRAAGAWRELGAEERRST
jgi:hypothetical protein